MKAATGASAWDRPRTLVASGTAEISGLAGPAAFASDLRDGRYSRRFTIALMGPSGEGFDGVRVWSQDISGGVHDLDAPFALRRAVTDAYLERRGYFNANSTARLRCVDDAREGDRTMQRIEVTPRNGIPAVLAIDPKTHLLASISERLPTTTQLTRFSDYREAGDLVLPFAIDSGTEHEPQNGYAFRVRTYAVSDRNAAHAFQRPADLHPPRMLGGVASTTVPLVLDGRQLLVWASIDGHPPMPFVLDTGGHAIFTTQAARELGLHPAGAGVSGGSGAGTIGLQFAPVATVRIGNAELADQTFLVIPYPWSFYDRGTKQPLAGILGLEIFERFAVRIDYGRRLLTLTPFARYASTSARAKLPIVFQDDMPLADAKVDEHPGLFGIDTGNAGTVILFDPFLQRTGLARAYDNGISAQGSGTGGTNAGRIVTLRQFAIAGTTLHAIPTFLTKMQSGSFSSWTEAGNFGYEILSHFVPTFDYARGVLYLETSSLAKGPPRNRAGFVATKDDPQTLTIKRVAAGSAAAAAGLNVGDRILAIDGRDAKELSYGDVYDFVTGPPGAVLTITLVRSGDRRDVRIVLR
jgi:hypothetical protein